MRTNPRIATLVDKLQAAGVMYRINWMACRDGKPERKGHPADVFHVSFVGNGFAPSVSTAIFLDYGPRDGFGFYTDTVTGTFDDMVAAIAKPLHDDSKPVQAKPEPLAAIDAYLSATAHVTGIEAQRRALIAAGNALEAATRAMVKAARFAPPETIAGDAVEDMETAKADYMPDARPTFEEAVALVLERVKP